MFGIPVTALVVVVLAAAAAVVVVITVFMTLYRMVCECLPNGIIRQLYDIKSTYSKVSSSSTNVQTPELTKEALTGETIPRSLI